METKDITLAVPVITADTKLSDIQASLSSNVYALCLKYFEKAELKGLVFGNGHHMAQDIGEAARKLLMEREK